MRRPIMLAVVVLALLFSGGCDPEQAPGAKPTGKATAAPKPSPAKTGCGNACPGEAVPVPGQQPPPPQADPGPYNDIHEVVAKVWWIGEHTGEVTIYKNGALLFQENASRPSKGEDGKYHGGYTRVVHGLNKGDEIELDWRPSIKPAWSMVVIYHNARIAAEAQSGEPNCLRSNGWCAIHAVIA